MVILVNNFRRAFLPSPHPPPASTVSSIAGPCRPAPTRWSMRRFGQCPPKLPTAGPGLSSYWFWATACLDPLSMILAVQTSVVGGRGDRLARLIHQPGWMRPSRYPTEARRTAERSRGTRCQRGGAPLRPQAEPGQRVWDAPSAGEAEELRRPPPRWRGSRAWRGPAPPTLWTSRLRCGTRPPGRDGQRLRRP